MIITIVFLDGFDFNSGVIGALAALLMIALNIPAGATVVYVIDRIADTFVGVLVAIGVNRFASPQNKKEGINLLLFAIIYDVLAKPK